MNKQKKTRREEFLNAAREIINSQGYEACTVRSLCEKVGVAASSFYNCFEDKDEVVFMLALEVDTVFAENEASFCLKDPKENLAMFMRMYFAKVEQDGYEYTWRFHMLQKGDRRHVDSDGDRALIRILYRIIHQGRAYWYDNMNEDDIFDLIMTLLRGQTFDWARREGTYSLTERACKHIPAFIRAVFKTEE